MMGLTLMEDALLIPVAPCIALTMRGGVQGSEFSPEGNPDEVVQACDAGASIVRLHGWDKHGRPVRQLSDFEPTVRLI